MMEWLSSVRSLSTLLLTITFCILALRGKIEAKDVMLIISLVYNFYFLVKKRDNGETKPQ